MHEYISAIDFLRYPVAIFSRHAHQFRPVVAKVCLERLNKTLRRILLDAIRTFSE